MIHSFLGDQIYQIQNLQTITAETFEVHLAEQNAEIIWHQEDYLAAFSRVQEALHSGKFDKLILSRIKEVPTQKNALTLFNDLNKLYGNTFNYLLSSRQTGTWIGATPELLLSCQGDELATVSIAGTKPSDGFSEWTQKEREEQKYVTDYILQTFAKHPVRNISATPSYTLKAGPVDHLKTDVRGSLSDLSHLFPLLNDLHPTPATCGIPKNESKLKIVEIESHSRKLYTGYIGILNETEKKFYVNLRCMELQKERALLYVGGGITRSSIGEREWLETERKAETLVRIL